MGSTISGKPASEEDWGLDGVGNWLSYLQKLAGTTTFNQTRTANAANEISGMSTTVGTVTATPAYNAAGNLTAAPTMPAPQFSHTVTDDAWNRAVTFAHSGTNVMIQADQYDGHSFRTYVKSYSSGSLVDFRHYYYTDDWRSVEERLDGTTTAARQYVWGDQYIDELILRERGSERLYVLQDANWNVTSVANTSGAVQERYTYTGYGQHSFWTAAWGSASSSSVNWETLFAGNHLDSGASIYQVRNRHYHQLLGAWYQRDPIGYGAGDVNLYRYVGSNPTGFMDPLGLDSLRRMVGVVYDDGDEIKAIAIDVDFSSDRANKDIIADAIRRNNKNRRKVKIYEWYLDPGVAVVKSKSSEPPPFDLSKNGGNGKHEEECDPNAPKTFDPFVGTGSNKGFGQLIGWGKGGQDAMARAASITLQEIQQAGITRPVAEYWLNFYKNALATGRGAATAPERIKLMERVLELLGG